MLLKALANRDSQLARNFPLHLVLVVPFVVVVNSNGKG